MGSLPIDYRYPMRGLGVLRHLDLLPRGIRDRDRANRRLQRSITWLQHEAHRAVRASSTLPLEEGHGSAGAASAIFDACNSAISWNAREVRFESRAILADGELLTVGMYRVR
jgi:hypothetical protein